MATTYNHAQIGIVDASGNINVIYPITTGADVSITRTNTKLPTAATTAQALANAFGKLAFADSEISDSETSTTKTWSSNKINTAITKLNSKLTENFQDGCDTIVAGCTTYGATPTSNSPANIVEAIKKIYTDRYNAGKSAGALNTSFNIKMKFIIGATILEGTFVAQVIITNNRPSIKVISNPSAHNNFNQVAYIYSMTI